MRQTSLNRWLLVPLLLLVLPGATCCRPGAPSAQAEHDHAANSAPGLDLAAVAGAAHAIGALLDDQQAMRLLDGRGCYLWQQPGVALTVTEVWLPGGTVDLWAPPKRMCAFLTALPGIKDGAPFIHPPEPASGEFHVEPQLYFLDAEQSHARLTEYMHGYQQWVEANPGTEFIVPAAAELTTDCALVYIDSSGPLEFHFQLLDDGRIVLRHLFSWEFFSA